MRSGITASSWIATSIALRRAPEIDYVDAQLFEAGKDWTYLSDRELYLLGTDGAAEALSRFRSPKIERELAHARELLTMPSAQVKALVQTDPLGLLTMLRDRMSREKSLVSFDPTQEGYVSQDGRSRLVVVKPKGAPFDTDFCKALFQRLSAVESAARQERPCQILRRRRSRFKPQAPTEWRSRLRLLIRRESVENSIGSMVILLLVVFAVFRTPWVMLYGCAPLVLGALLTLGLNGLIKGSLSPATSGSAGMLFGLGIDGVVLLYLRYLEERRTGASVDDAIRGMSGTASSVVLAQMTTAATFLALLLIDFPTLQDLGSLVGLGILLCCGLTRDPAAGAAVAKDGRSCRAGADDALARTLRDAASDTYCMGQRHHHRCACGRVYGVAFRPEYRKAAGPDRRHGT